jgi:hypothetical protein
MTPNKFPRGGNNERRTKWHPARNSRKIIKSPIPNEPEKAQIAVEGADHLYRELRITNTLTRENGDEVSLKPGAQVQVTVEAEAGATTPKK